MKQNLRLRGGVCPDEPSEVSYQPLVNAASRTDKILRRVGKASPVMSDELLVISSLVPCVQRYLASYRFLRSAQACLIPPVEMTGNLKDIGRNAREIWRDALTERPNASAGRRNAKKNTAKCKEI
ncbi:hypothetical protein [Olivibacter sp. XZL3]|uniref:hypothetical protein n=1 Tax=Olivibacter sp. XZL3 TaxID=1735116 RepID=UPI0010665040|nr:hypothetical protein [Olivibacter sp. XZL3]